jgi:hypothetical protein
MSFSASHLKQTVLALSLATAFAAPVHADEVSDAKGVSDFFISGDYNRNIWDADDFKRYKDNGYRIRGSASYQSTSGLGVQFDGVYTDKDIGYQEFSVTDIAGHVFFRNDRFLFGAFGQYRHPTLTHNFRSTGNSSEDACIDLSADEFAKVATPEQTFWGLETQGYFGDFTLNAQAGAQVFINQHKPYNVVPKLLDHGYFASLGGTYFIYDNWKVDAVISHNHIRTNGDFGGLIGDGGSMKQSYFGLSTEGRIPNTPVSMFASAGRTNLDYGSFGMNNDQITLGLKLSFGGAETLKSQNRSGASLNPVSMDPIGSVMMGTVFNGFYDNPN